MSRETVETLMPGLRRRTAPNPGPMTGPGTNTYLLGERRLLVVDPGVADAEHLADLEAAINAAQTAAIVITHDHPDHVGGAAELAAATGAPVWAFEARLDSAGSALAVDRRLVDGDRLAADDEAVEVLATPGHTADHLCLWWPARRLLLAGDTVMADVTVVILPPEGRMSDYLASLDRLEGLGIERIAPAHGGLIEAATDEIAGIRAHRLEREAQVWAALDRKAARSADAIALTLYPQIDERIRPMAAAQVEAHLVRLAELGRARHDSVGWRRLG